MALLPPGYLQCVAAIGVTESGEPHWIASAFYYGFVREEGGDKWWNVVLVTNRHVFDGLKQVVVRLNAGVAEPARLFELPLLEADGSPSWYTHPDPEIDIAYVPTTFQKLRELGITADFFSSANHTAATLARMKEVGFSEGDGVFVLGFPMGLVGKERNVVVVRSGSIARLGDAYNSESRTFLIDALVFPGNSGGPVVSKPEVAAIANTKAVNASYLIGVVTGYVPYEERAISEQTGRVRIVFQENSGLVEIHPVDYIEEAIHAHLEELIRKSAKGEPQTGR